MTLYNTYYYCFGVRCFKLEIPSDMKKPQNLSKFEIPESDCSKDYTQYILNFTEDLESIIQSAKKEQVSGRVVNRENLHVFPTTTGECRLIQFFGASSPYAISWQKAPSIFHVWINKPEQDLLIHDTVFISLLSLEKHMIKDNALILHSAYMLHNGKAILFSAPSETGKSTQASLWEKYRGTRTINGDRSLLLCQNNTWYAKGWPICGSSEICFNETYPIQAIVMLKQAKENKTYPLKGMSALKELMSQITINSWDSDFQIKALDQIEKLITEIPVYRLECNISEDAVACLEKALHA